jgi:hypothetical protein
LFDIRRSLKRVEIQRQPIDIGSAGAFRQHDPVGPARDDGGEIAERQTRIQRVDTDIDLLVRIPRVEHVAHGAPGADLFIRRDRILEVEDQRLGRSFLGVFELAQAVTRDEQEGSHRHAFGLQCIRPVRRQLATTSPR